MIRRAFLAAGLALLAAAVLPGCSGRKAEPIARGAKVLVVGDSVTAAFGLAVEQSWTTTLAAESGWQVINAGVSGDTTEGGRARLGQLLEEHQPAAVIVELGGNDMLRRQPTAATVANLDAMIDEIKARGARPILMATPQPSIAGAVLSSLSDAPFYAEVAERRKLPLIDKVLSNVLSQQEFKLDHLHPNAEGHRELGAAVAKRLRGLGLIAG